MSLLAVTPQQKIGGFVAAFVFVGWLVYLVVTLRRRTPTTYPGAELELAPNRRPYLDDDTLESKRLERGLSAALLLLVICAAGPLVYWLREPSRQEGAERGFKQRAVSRGFELFQPTDAPGVGHFGCANCHGSKGQGGSARYTLTDSEGNSRQVTWQAPPVDTALLKFSKDNVRTILVYGRDNTPMPAWGVEGGGPMNAQQIDDLVAYLQSITLTPEEAQARAMEEALGEARRLGKIPEDAAFPAMYVDGEVLFNTNCARCHTKGWAFGEADVSGGGAFGPNLLGGVSLRQFPDVSDQVEFVSEGSVYAEGYGERGVGGNEGGGMPGFGKVLTEAQIRAVVDYERGL